MLSWSALLHACARQISPSGTVDSVVLITVRCRVAIHFTTAYTNADNGLGQGGLYRIVACKTIIWRRHCYRLLAQTWRHQGRLVLRPPCTNVKCPRGATQGVEWVVPQFLSECLWKPGDCQAPRHRYAGIRQHRRPFAQLCIVGCSAESCRAASRVFPPVSLVSPRPSRPLRRHV